MSASYTPGPWFRDPYGNICDARGKTVEANGLASLCSPEGEHGDVMRANARLISAAPDLVEALKKADRAIQAAYAQSDNGVTMSTDPAKSRQDRGETLRRRS